MTIKDYISIIDKTAVFPRKVEDFGLAYCLIGLFDELNEVEEKVDNKDTIENIHAEVGDVLWYLCALCNELDISFEGVVTNTYKFGKEYNPVNLFGIIKKHYRDNKPIDKEYVFKSLCNLSRYLFYTTKINDSTLISILESNYNKLIARRETNTLHGDGDNREKNQ